MSCPEFLEHMEKVYGEPVLPSLYVSPQFKRSTRDWNQKQFKLSNAQLNIGAVGKDKKVDQWHFDSINFVAVLIFSNIDNMIGTYLNLLRLSIGQTISIVGGVASIVNHKTSRKNGFGRSCFHE